MSFISFFCGNWCRTASGNDCIFLCWRNADRRSEASGDRTADPFALSALIFMGRKIYMDRQNKKQNKWYKKSLSMDGIMTFSVQSLEKIYTIFLESVFSWDYNRRY